MAWNEPGNGQRDPWNKNQRTGNKKPGLDAALRNLRKRLGKFGGGPGGLLTIVAGVVLAGALFTSYTVVGTGQVGVVERFGAYARTLSPGLHFKLPLPFETVDTVATARARAISSQIRMLTSDQDIVTVDYNVQYQVSDPQKYLYVTRDPDGGLSEAAQAAVRAVVGTQSMDSLLGIAEGAPTTAVLQQQASIMLQKMLDSYDCGLRVTQLSFQAITPPQDVKDAFDDVNAAREEKQTAMDQARAASGQVIPLAKGDAARMAAEADAYKAERIATAQGETQRFELVLKEYKAAPDVTRRRLWLETMEQVLGASRKVIDGDGHSVINIAPSSSDTSIKDLPAVGAVAQPATDEAGKGKQP